LFFFFQAEDGIRDFHVTGVQTCALPISEKPDHSLLRVRFPGLPTALQQVEGKKKPFWNAPLHLLYLKLLSRQKLSNPRPFPQRPPQFQPKSPPPERMTCSWLLGCKLLGRSLGLQRAEY